MRESDEDEHGRSVGPDTAALRRGSGRLPTLSRRAWTSSKAVVSSLLVASLCCCKFAGSRVPLVVSLGGCDLLEL
jgi:hypothetical protein